MCGIFGFTKFKNFQLQKARDSLNTLHHRGPDQYGEYFDENIYMGHKRLSIIDISNFGKQPMISEDKNIVMSINGEIYNFIQLKNELIKKYSFKSNSDSEVVLYGYIEWGIDRLLEKIDGMFAISIYDKRQNELYLVRDRFGKKPLFYTQKEGTIFYSSEIKAFFEFDDEFRVFSYDSIKDWIYHRGSYSKTTIFYNIFKLSPGEYIKIKNSKIVKQKRYYDILDHVSNETYSTNLQEISSYLDNAISKRLISDVPLGLQLSGGVDSSLVGYFIKNHKKEEVHSFSVGFLEDEYKRYSEEKYANYVAKKVGLTHHQCNITQLEVMENFKHVVWLFDGMLDYPNAIALYMLSKYAKKYVTVTMTGEGADEIFGGYLKLKNMQSLEFGGFEKKIPDFIIEYIINIILRRKARAIYLKKEYGGDTKSILENINCYISPKTFTKIFGKNEKSLFDEIDYNHLREYPFYKQLLIMDHKTYLHSLLDRQDRASMGASIESRLPFLDKDLIHWAINLNKDELFDDKENKMILKKISASIYGKKFTYRSKMGFPLPLKQWLDHEDGFKTYVDKIFDDDFLLKKYIDMNFVKKYLNSKSFDKKNLNYPDSERMWIKWFLMIIRASQDIFNIRDCR